MQARNVPPGWSFLARDMINAGNHNPDSGELLRVLQQIEAHLAAIRQGRPRRTSNGSL